MFFRAMPTYLLTYCKAQFICLISKTKDGLKSYHSINLETPRPSIVWLAGGGGVAQKTKK